MNGAELFIKTLADEGIEYLFSLPGTCLMDIYDAASKQDQVKVIVTRHEQVATLMADGYSRVSGKPGVALVSRGPGSCNAAIGVYSAFGESSPVLLVVGSVSDNISHFEPFEILDFQTFFKPMTKWTHEIHDFKQIETVTRRALRDTQAGRPRPVVLGIPMQYSQMTEDYELVEAPQAVTAKTVPSDSDLEKAINILRSANKPIIIAGGGVARSGSYQELAKLAEACGAPVVTTWLRNSVFPNEHRLYMGSLGPGAFTVSWEAVEQADVVFAVGTRFSEFSTKRFTLIKAHQKLIHLDVDVKEIHKVFAADVGLVGDAKSTLQKLNQALAALAKADSAQWDGLIAKFNELRNAVPKFPREEGKITNADVVTIMDRILSKDSIVVIDAATFDPWLSRYYRFTEPNTFLGCSAGCMGFGFPAAMGAKLAEPSKPVVLAVGDGSFAMVMQDLATAVRDRIGIVIIVTNNSTYGNIRERQRKDFNGRIIGSDLHNPEFGEVAESFGAWGKKADTPEQFRNALQEALTVAESGRPALINVSLDINDGMPHGSKPPVAR